MRRILICNADDCPAMQEGDEYADGEPCPNCGEGELVEYVAVTREEVDGRNGDYVLSGIRAMFARKGTDE